VNVVAVCYVVTKVSNCMIKLVVGVAYLPPEVTRNPYWLRNTSEAGEEPGKNTQSTDRYRHMLETDIPITSYGLLVISMSKFDTKLFSVNIAITAYINK